MLPFILKYVLLLFTLSTFYFIYTFLYRFGLGRAERGRVERQLTFSLSKDMLNANCQEREL